MTKRSLLGNSASLALFLALAVAFSITATAAGQDKKQKKVKQDTKEDPMPMPPIPTPDELDRNIGEMLGAWQVGDVDAMHKFYADDATFTSGAFEPPIVAGSAESMPRSVSSPPSSGCEAIPITQLTEVKRREPRSPN